MVPSFRYRPLVTLFAHVRGCEPKRDVTLGHRGRARFSLDEPRHEPPMPLESHVRQSLWQRAPSLQKKSRLPWPLVAPLRSPTYRGKFTTFGPSLKRRIPTYSI